MTRSEFDVSLNVDQPPPQLSTPLTTLWWISKDQWQRAHDLIDAAPGADCAWVHAHLHRIEGDAFNANYWYRRAGKTTPDYGLDREREVLLEYFLD